MGTARRAENHSLHERGVALVLCFLVILILICVIASLVTVSNVDYSLSVNAQHALQAEAAERAAFAKAEALLLLDLSQHEGSAPADPTVGVADAAGSTDTAQPLAIPAATASMAGPDGNPAGSDSPGASAQASGLGPPDDSAAPATVPVSNESDTAVPAAVDSWLDAWADASLTRIECGEVTARIAIVDEDSKLNLLGLLVEDAAEHERNRDRLVRLLDHLREGMALDVSSSEARSIVNGITGLLRGERESERRPRPEFAQLYECIGWLGGLVPPNSHGEVPRCRRRPKRDRRHR